jgi:energy-coupling factor transport system substrate-specific component
VAPPRIAKRVKAIRLRPRSTIAVAMATFLGLVAFTWPFVVQPGTFGSAQTAPLMFGVLLVVVLAVVLAEVAEGGIDAKALAMLGVLSAIGAALRPLGAGTAGIETVFFTIVLAGRVFGAGFGVVLGCSTLFASAVITGGVGPWLPFQMIAAGWVGFFAGCLPRSRGRTEVATLALYSFGVGLAFGLVMNLWFWPFASYGPETSFVAGDPFVENLHRYAVFYVTTSLPWDLGRAVLSALLLLLAGSALLRALRRASRRAAFDAVVSFE